jgi:hypothetical protein
MRCYRLSWTVTSRPLSCYPILGQPKLEFFGVLAHAGRGAREPLNSDIGGLLPIALCGRNSL